MSTRRKTLLAIVMVPLAMLLAIGSITVANAHPAGQLAANRIDRVPRISISAFTFTVPRKVIAGTTIKIVNKDAFKHTVTADDLSFDVTVPGSSTVKFKVPAVPGKYPFHCSIHTTMQATLNVR